MPRGVVLRHFLVYWFVGFGDVWNQFCEVNGVPAKEDWFAKVAAYEKDVLAGRQ